MKHIQKKQPYTNINSLTNVIFDENSIFLDIETTGFSPSNAAIYLIGCMRKHDDFLIIDQFFAENLEDEQELLKHFIELLQSYTTIITFNGLGFDLPFIKAKCNVYDIPENLSTCSNIDIFKFINKMKFFLKLTNYKQKTLEQFLGIQREDKFTGGELIQVYQTYLQTPTPEAEQLLLLHNFEDVLGMLDLLPILSYHKLFEGHYTISSNEIVPYTSFEGEEKQELIITLNHEYPVPKRVSCQYEDYYLSIQETITKIRISLFEGELRYFYPNYKDYFYLPAEDMAIHKSVASFVDKEYRQKAKASNCYTRKTGYFLPQYDEIITPALKKEYKDKCSFFELTKDFHTSDLTLRKYVEYIICFLSKQR